MMVAAAVAAAVATTTKPTRLRPTTTTRPTTSMPPMPDTTKTTTSTTTMVDTVRPLAALVRPLPPLTIPTCTCCPFKIGWKPRASSNSKRKNRTNDTAKCAWNPSTRARLLDTAPTVETTTTMATVPCKPLPDKDKFEDLKTDSATKTWTAEPASATDASNKTGKRTTTTTMATTMDTGRMDPGSTTAKNPNNNKTKTATTTTTKPPSTTATASTAKNKSKNSWEKPPVSKPESWNTRDTEMNSTSRPDSCAVPMERVSPWPSFWTRNAPSTTSPEPSRIPSVKTRTTTAWPTRPTPSWSLP
mmetsp:Transcript_6414/g.18072  ORF Transcript_6414/g.18072 Transcript_6414/m.18072 type:complete len:302 (+) Transcript_6414:431-1336(+)